MDSTLTRPMTMEPEQIVPEKSFVRDFLPWIIAAAALVIYLVTLNRWVTLGSLVPVAEISGWTWQPEVHAPMYWLVTYPFRWLPVKSIPIALNIFAAVCAALTLMLLARCVALLPHDRTHDQRQREKNRNALLSIPSAWLPPVLAAIVCGLQLTFWEHATVTSGGVFPQASGEMFDLLLIAYIVRSLLEFRIDQRESWLTRGALIYGAAITNNWAMIGFFPLFIVALIWIRGLEFFNVRFLMRMFICGLAGLSFFLILPIVQSLADIAPIPFWRGLKYNIVGEQATLLAVLRYFKDSKQVSLVFAFISFVPLLLISIRWASYFGDTSKLGIALTTLIFRVVHMVFLVACIWVALDPAFSPRFNPLNTIFNIRFLPIIFFSALCVGYFSGYLLLIFSGRGERQRSGFLRFFNVAVTAGVWVLFIATPVILIFRNLPQIRATNGSALKRYAGAMMQALPPGKIILLADPDVGANAPKRLLLMQSAAAQIGRSKDIMFLDTASLKWPDYHRFLKKKYGNAWTFNPPTNSFQLVSDTNLMVLVGGMARTNQVWYLQPSFGYYFEVLYPESHGLVYHMKNYPHGTLTLPNLAPEVLKENENFWAKEGDELIKPVLAAKATRSHTKNPAFMDQVTEALRLKDEPNRQLSELGVFYSRALCFWGDELQRHDKLEEAAAQFKRAEELNPDNVVAKVNLQCNENLRAGRTGSVPMPKAAEDEYGKQSRWDAVVAEDGPFDEPNRCFEGGKIYLKAGLYRQAANQFSRTIKLASDNLQGHLMLAQLCVLSGFPDQALQIVDEVHQKSSSFYIARTNSAELLSVEASAHLSKRDLEGAEATVQKALEKFPGDEDILGTASQIFLNYGQYSNAIQVIDKELKIYPDNVNALATKGYAYLQMGAFDQAVPPLTRVLEVETNASETHFSALLNRAIALLRGGKLDEARKDYEVLQKAFPTAFRVYFGLGDIAYQKQDTNAAIRYYDLYIANSPTNTEESKLVLARLKELKAHTP